MLETMETRWAPAIDRTFGAESVARPEPSLWAAFLAAATSLRGAFIPPAGYTEKPATRVRVNHGVWQTVCPFCPAAQHASSEHRWFFCARCHNAAVGRLMIPVEWPANADEIERHLVEQRPIRDYRNWEPGETLAELEAQDTRARASWGDG